MYTLYSMRRSGNCYKVRLALAQLDIAHELVEIDILQGRDPHAGIPGDESERPRAAARGRARTIHRRVERDPVVRRRRHAAAARRPRSTAPKCCSGCSSSSTASSPTSAPPISG